MDSQKQDRIYTNLLRIWRQTVKTSQLVKLKDKDSFFDEIQELTLFLKQQYTENTPEPQKVLIQATLDNIHYMVRDILNYRADKILNSARLHIKLDENLLFNFEVEYFRNIFFAFRGFSGSKHLILDNIRMEYKDSKKSSLFSKLRKEKISDTPLSSPQLQDGSTISPNLSSPESEFEMPDDDYDFPEEIVNDFNQLKSDDSNSNSLDFEQEIPSFHDKTTSNPLSELNSKDEIKKEENMNGLKFPSNISGTADKINFTQKEFDYIPIRILQPISSIVGADMQIYGPFDTEDVAYLPRQNALLLQEEHLAKLISIGN